MGMLARFAKSGYPEGGSHAMNTLSTDPTFSEVSTRENGHGLGVFAARAFSHDEKIFVFVGSFVSVPDKFTIQVDDATHLHLGNHIGSLLSHSCKPNTRFCGEKLSVIAIAPIQPGEELTFNYLCTEWDMAEPFECRCGSELCHRVIRGFRYLSPANQLTLEPHAVPYLQRRVGKNAN